MNNFDIVEFGYVPEDLREWLINGVEGKYINFKLEDVQNMYKIQYNIDIIIDSDIRPIGKTYKYVFRYNGKRYDNTNYPTYNRALYEAIQHVNILMNNTLTHEDTFV